MKQYSPVYGDITFLAQYGHLPCIYKGDINDKTKANGLAIILVIVQAG